MVEAMVEEHWIRKTKSWDLVRAWAMTNVIEQPCLGTIPPDFLFTMSFVFQELRRFDCIMVRCR